MSRPRFALAVAGAPFAGKTTVAAVVSGRTEAPHVSFGDYVRARATSLGRSPTRDVLQELGQSLFLELGGEGLCLSAIQAAGVSIDARPVVWDGVRHVAVYRALQDFYTSDLRLVYLDPPAEARRQRLADEADTPERLEQWEHHSTEADAEALKSLADLVCTAAELNAAIAEVLSYLDRVAVDGLATS